MGEREVGATWRSSGPGEASGVPQGPHQPLRAVLCLLQELRPSLLLKTPACRPGDPRAHGIPSNKLNMLQI